jgi:ABC-type multidrug transport system fused ATPase/permease subunit
MNRAEGGGFKALLTDYRDYAGARLWLALAVMLLAAVAEGFGLLMIVPLASAAIGTGASPAARWVPFTGQLSADQRIAGALAVFLAAMAARSLLLFARDVQIARLETGYEASLRLRAAATLANRGWPFAARIGQAGMQSLLLNDVPRAGQAAAYFQQFAVAALMLLVQLTLTALLAPVLTLVALLILVVGGAVSLRWTRRGARSGVAIVGAMEESASSGFRLHAGLKASLAQGTVPSFLGEYAASLHQTATQFVQYARDYTAARQLGMFGAAVAAAILLFVGVRVLAMPFAVLVTTLIIFARMSGPAINLQQSAQQVAVLAPAFGAIQSRLGELEPPRTSQPAGAPLEWADFRMDAVSFEHQAGLGVKSASLAITAGEWIGIAGPSGAGKTTLVDLVAGLLMPSSGSITVDDATLEDGLLGRWRLGLAYVGQEGTVFNDTVRANLLAEGAAADEEELWGALEQVGLAGRIRSFPDGLDENVGDRGSQLSGGERQRLVLARALLRRPTLLILDEATAALDPESEAQVVQRLRSLDPRPAALVVAHRKSSLAHCDSVVSIRHGIVEKAGD